MGLVNGGCPISLGFPEECAGFGFAMLGTVWEIESHREGDWGVIFYTTNPLSLRAAFELGPI